MATRTLRSDIVRRGLMVHARLFSRRPRFQNSTLRMWGKKVLVFFLCLHFFASVHELCGFFFHVCFRVTMKKKRHRVFSHWSRTLSYRVSETLCERFFVSFFFVENADTFEWCQRQCSPTIIIPLPGTMPAPQIPLSSPSPRGSSSAAAVRKVAFDEASVFDGGKNIYCSRLGLGLG